MNIFRQREMDVIAHGLWAYLAAKFTNLHLKKKLKTWLFVSFAVMPDFLAFAPMFILLIVGLITGTSTGFFHPSGMEPAGYNTTLIHNITGTLYNFTHSLFIFIIVFFLVWIIFRKPVVELFGWLLHILMDIPSHSYKFYPTPFLWPVSSWKYDGISWGNPWFMVVNYSLIILFYIGLRIYSKKFKKGKQLGF